MRASYKSIEILLDLGSFPFSFRIRITFHKFFSFAIDECSATRFFFFFARVGNGNVGRRERKQQRRRRSRRDTNNNSTIDNNRRGINRSEEKRSERRRSGGRRVRVCRRQQLRTALDNRFATGCFALATVFVVAMATKVLHCDCALARRRRHRARTHCV